MEELEALLEHNLEVLRQYAEKNVADMTALCGENERLEAKATQLASDNLDQLREIALLKNQAEVLRGERDTFQQRWQAAKTIADTLQGGWIRQEQTIHVLRGERDRLNAVAVTLLEKNGGLVNPAPEGSDDDDGPETHVFVRIEDFKALEQAVKSTESGT